jgi:hypothetical protein
VLLVLLVLLFLLEVVVPGIRLVLRLLFLLEVVVPGIRLALRFLVLRLVLCLLPFLLQFLLPLATRLVVVVQRLGTLPLQRLMQHLLQLTRLVLARHKNDSLLLPIPELSNRLLDIVFKQVKCLLLFGIVLLVRFANTTASAQTSSV